MLHRVSVERAQIDEIKQTGFSEVYNRKQTAGGQHETPRPIFVGCWRGPGEAVIFLTGLRVGMDFFFFSLLKEPPLANTALPGKQIHSWDTHFSSIIIYC